MRTRFLLRITFVIIPTLGLMLLWLLILPRQGQAAHHEQCRTDTLAGYVANRQHQMVGVRLA